MAVEEAGGRVESVYWAIGKFDGAIVFEAPEEKAAGLLLDLASDGFVRTQTARVHHADEFAKIVPRN